MKTKYVLITLPVLLLILALGGAEALEYPLPPETSYFNQATWRPNDRLTIPRSGYELTEDTYLKVDHLVLNGPLYTNGHELKIDALKITFNSNGAIRGFKGPPPSAPKPDDGPTGKIGARDGGRGQNGIKPLKPKARGASGHQNPRAIVIYAARVDGVPIIDGTGQPGAKGTHGAKGGKGGKGGPGKNAKASCSGILGASHYDGGPGGKGGTGSPGGDGGDGGIGGAPIPIVFAVGQQPKTAPKIIAERGPAGEPGDPGLPGDPGDAGDGGHGASKKCGLGTWKDEHSGGPGGTRGDIQTEYGKKGGEGILGPPVILETEPFRQFKEIWDEATPGRVFVGMHVLETARLQLVDAWAQFHWARTFLFLTLDTIGALQSSTATPSLGEFFADDTDEFVKALKRSDEIRRLKLIELWERNPLPEHIGAKIEILRDANASAEKIVALLKSATADPSEIEPLITDMRGALSALLDSSLSSALQSCREYGVAKDGQKKVVLNLTTQYTVPVCERIPDFTLPENVDKAIVLFSKSVSHVPESLAKPGMYKDFQARFNPFKPAVDLLWPKAYAAGFEAVPFDSQKDLASDILARLPPRDQWQVDELGVFTGFPRISRTDNISEIGHRLFYLQQNLKRIRTR